MDDANQPANSHKHVSLPQHLLPEWTGDGHRAAIEEAPRKPPSQSHRKEMLCLF